MRPKNTFTAALCAFGIWSVTTMANAAEIKVLSTLALKEAYTEFAPQFERVSGHKLTPTWSPIVDAVKRVQAGEVYDLVIVSAVALDDLIKQGKIAPGSRVDLVKSGIGVAVRTGAPKPDLSSADGVKKAILAAKTVGYSSGSSGVYIESLFRRWGIAEQIKDKIKRTPPGVLVGGLIARGEVDIGFQTASEIILFPGIQYVGTLPADIQNFTMYVGGVHAGAKEPEAARTLIKFITSPEALPAIRKSGMEPG